MRSNEEALEVRSDFKIRATIPAGAFPRELRLTADGRTLFATNFASRTLEMIDLARAPIAKSP